MVKQFEEVRKNFLEEVKAAKTRQESEQLRVKYLGRSGIINKLMKAIPTLPAEERAQYGRQLNALKNEVTDHIKKLHEKLPETRSDADITLPDSDTGASATHELFDITLPGKRPVIGKRHPLTQTIDDIKEVFARLGFDVAYGPEVELEYYNFEALNIPPDHPSRTDFDTFYIKEDVLLRSQTSTVQIRIMEKQKPPIRIIAPGVVYRPDTVDAKHSFMFHQIEGLFVDEGVSFADLKGVLIQFIQTFFGQEVKMCFRPSFFPFTEPSAEIDIWCENCKMWVEILGAGMVDPNVFKAVHYDPEKYTGFAFGLGVERIAMCHLRYGINDIRLFYNNDIRFLSQF